MENNGRLDLDDLAKRLRLNVEIAAGEDPEEGAFERKQKEADARFKRVKDAVLFGVAILLVVAVSSICIWVAVSKEFGPEDKKWAIAILTLIIGSITGYLTGKSAR